MIIIIKLEQEQCYCYYFQETIQLLLKDPVIAGCRQKEETEELTTEQMTAKQGLQVTIMGSEVGNNSHH